MNRSKYIVPFPDLKIIEEEAATWVAHMDTRALSEEERSHFKKWIGQSSQHQEIFERVSSIWGGCDILDELNYIDHEVENIDAISSVKRKNHWLQISIAASVIFTFTMLLLQTSGYFNQTQDAHFITTVGGQKTLELVDGSTIILNTNSEIDIKITRISHTGNLSRGEAHFDVASDMKRPFEVFAGGGVVEAVGTAFTVQLHQENVEVTVTDGVVKLLTQPETQITPVFIESENEQAPALTAIAALTAGQNAVFSKQIQSVEWMSDDELEQKLLWREGFIIFAGEPLSKVVADISRYTEIIIEIEEPSLEETPIGGRFKVGDVEGLFEALENIFNVKVNRINSAHVKLSFTL